MLTAHGKVTLGLELDGNKIEYLLTGADLPQKNHRKPCVFKKMRVYLKEKQRIGKLYRYSAVDYGGFIVKKCLWIIKLTNFFYHRRNPWKNYLRALEKNGWRLWRKSIMANSWWDEIKDLFKTKKQKGGRRKRKSQ
ncbi:MAG: hypothetical protein L6V85_08965 [Clostridiales bacterium]|nr:MAG: hypothetical protein L6V85_08965 [Clostridiales bacterium]